MQEIFSKLKDTAIQTERALLVNKNYSVFYSGDHVSAAAAAWDHFLGGGGRSGTETRLKSTMQLLKIKFLENIYN